LADSPRGASTIRSPDETHQRGSDGWLQPSTCCRDEGRWAYLSFHVANWRPTLLESHPAARRLRSQVTSGKASRTCHGRCGAGPGRTCVACCQHADKSQATDQDRAVVEGQQFAPRERHDAVGAAGGSAPRCRATLLRRSGPPSPYWPVRLTKEILALGSRASVPR
jgi:hypothetical protein